MGFNAAVRQQADERLQKVLTPEQWKQFQQERDEMRSRERQGRPDNRWSTKSNDAGPTTRI